MNEGSTDRQLTWAAYGNELQKEIEHQTSRSQPARGQLSFKQLMHICCFNPSSVESKIGELNNQPISSIL